jgi:hypothetical protein
MSKHATNYRRLIKIGGITALGVAATLGLVTPSAAGAQTRGVTVIASRLNNPRGLSPAARGGLYLAEAGSGGKACVSGGEQGTTCIGKTGSFDLVSRYGSSTWSPG